jgi:hypothetical protein
MVQLQSFSHLLQHGLNLSQINQNYVHSSYKIPHSLTCPCQITIILRALIFTAHMHGPTSPGTIPAFTTSFSQLLFIVLLALEKSLPSLPHSHSLYAWFNLPWNNPCLHYLIFTAYIHGLTCPGSIKIISQLQG